PTYVAVGASETTGVGSQTPLREAWPRLLFRSSMPSNTVFVNMGVPGATVAQALRLEVGPTLDLKPAIVTDCLNVNDIIAGSRAARGAPSGSCAPWAWASGRRGSRTPW